MCLMVSHVIHMLSSVTEYREQFMVQLRSWLIKIVE